MQKNRFFWFKIKSKGKNVYSILKASEELDRHLPIQSF